MAFSVRWLLLTVAFVGLVFAGMLYATEHWVAGVNGLFLIACLFCVVVAIYGLSEHRAFAVGFLCFGLPYFAVTNKILGDTPERYIITHFALETLHPSVTRLSEIPTTENSGFYTDAEKALERARKDGWSRFYKPGGGVVIQIVRPIEVHFVELGHAFCAIVFGVLGGSVARALNRRYRPNAVGNPPSSRS
jgi:hypothetical protein